MNVDITFHYPPELMNLLIDVIPLLNRSKQDIFLFFRGAGVSEALMSSPHKLWEQDNKSINKFEIVRQILTGINEQGERCLRERREILRRIVEFENFTVCWESDQFKAKGLVAEIRDLVNVKDSFTRMKQEREKELKQRIAYETAKKEAVRQKSEEIENVKQELYKLFSLSNPHQRGKSLEAVLNRLFKTFNIGVREAFIIVGEVQEGMVEQIDGVIEIEGHLYFVEMKWWANPIGVPEVSQHLVRVYHRAESRAIIISASDFTAPAVTTCKEALQNKVVVLCTLQEIVMLLEQQSDLKEFIKTKAEAAISKKNPFFQPLTSKV